MSHETCGVFALRYAERPERMRREHCPTAHPISLRALGARRTDSVSSNRMEVR